LGTCLGVIFLAVIGNGLTMMGISSYWNGVTVGLALLVGITVSKYQQEILAIWKRRPIPTS
jgi:ribose/xylose/arabinose/galactoside ABC-type transport system permease subunit